MKIRAFDEPATLRLPDRRRGRQVARCISQHQHRAALVFLAQQLNQLRARTREVQPAHLDRVLECGIVFQQSDHLRATGAEVRAFAVVHELGLEEVKSITLHNGEWGPVLERLGVPAARDRAETLAELCDLHGLELHTVALMLEAMREASQPSPVVCLELMTLDRVCDHLESDHRDLQEELQRVDRLIKTLVKELRELRGKVRPVTAAAIAEVRWRLDRVSDRLVEHNALEETRAYRWVSALLNQREQENLADGIRRELENVPARLRSEPHPRRDGERE